MFIKSAVYSQFTFKRNFSLYNTHPAYVQSLSQTRSSYYYTQYNIFPHMGDRKPKGIFEFSIDSTRRKISSLGSPNFIFIALTFRKIIVFVIKVYNDLQRCTLSTPNL